MSSPYEVAEAVAYSLVDPDKLDAVDDAWIKRFVAAKHH